MPFNKSLSFPTARPCRVLAAICLATCSVHAAAQTNPLTLDEAMNLAERNHPSLRAAQHRLAPAQAERKDAAAILWNNPQLNAEARQRKLAQPGQGYATRSDTGVGVSQLFEIGGQPRARRVATEASLEAAQQTIEQARREVRLEAAKHFIEVLSLQSRVQTEQTAAGLLRQAADVVVKRVNAGEDTRLDGNLATVEAERAANQLSQARDELIQARAALAVTLQLPPAALPEAGGSLAMPDVAYTLEELLSSADGQPLLQAAAARERAASGRLALEHAARYPDLTVGLSYSPERGIDGTDRVTTLTLSVPLPLFRNNAAAVARANAELEQSRIELQVARRNSEASVRVLWQRVDQLRQRVKRLEAVVVPAMQENQRLSLAALRAGEIGVTQFLLARRQAVEAQRELGEAQSQATLARLELEAAAGWSPSPATLPGIARPSS